MESELKATREPEGDDGTAKSSRAAVGWKSCILLAVMLVGILSTPVALFYGWTQARPVRPEDEHFDNVATGVNRIAFVTPENHLVTVRDDGSDLRKLAELPDGTTFPAWSPNGSMLAVTAGARVYIMETRRENLDGNSPAPVYDDPDLLPFYVYWSPDASQLSFLTNHPDGLALQIVKIRAQQNTAKIIAIGQPLYWDWTQDGKQLLIHSGVSGPEARLALIDNLGEGEDISQPGNFQAPGFSRSGRFQAYAELDQSGTSRLVIDDGLGNDDFHETHLGQIAMLWSPSSDLLAFTSPQSEGGPSYGPLKLANPIKNQNDILVSDNVIAFFWSPDGTKIAYFTFSEQDIGGVQARTIPIKNNIQGEREEQSGRLTLNFWIVDLESRSKNLLLKFTPSRAFSHQFLPFFDQYALSHRIWSPRSDAIVLPIMEGGISHVGIVPVTGGDVEFIGAGESAFWSYQ